MQKLKNLDRDLEVADGVYIGLIFPEERHLLHSGISLQKGTWFVLVLLHSRTYFGGIKAFSFILKHFPFFNWITTIKENNIIYINLN